MEIYALVLAVSIPTLILLVGVGWLFSLYLHKHYHHSLERAGNSIRSLVIDKRNKTVRFFNHNQVRDVRTITLDQFYLQFNKSDIDRVDAWLESILKKNSKAEEYFEIDVYMNRTHKRYFSVLKLVDVNREKKIIHVDSYLFKYLERRTKAGYKITDTSYDEVMKQLKFTPSFRGSTISFSFSFLNKNSTKSVVNHLLFTQLKEIALVYAYPPQRYLVEVNPSEFVIFDLKSASDDMTLRFAHRILDAMRRFLEINSQLDGASINIGVVKNSFFPKKAKKLIEVAREMAIIAANRNVEIVSYTKELSNQGGARHSEIEKAIKERKLRYTYESVYDVKHERVLGYLSYVSLTGGAIKTIEELYNRAVKTDESKKLLTAIVHDSVGTFKTLNKDTTKLLFRDLKFIDTDLFIQLLPKRNEVKIVPCYDEYDISYYTSQNRDFLNVMQSLKDKGISACLKLGDKNLVLDHKIYDAFDYFIVYLDKDKFKTNSNSLLGYRTIVEKLLRYNKPIIITRADSWSLAELVVRSGVNYIAGSSICPAGPTLTSPSSKNILKIRKMLE